MLSRRRQEGLSLVELMISVTLGLLVLAGLLTLFNQNSQAFRQTDAAAQMQDNARFAMDALTRDLSMAGFMGGVYVGADVQLNTPPPPTPANDCYAGWYNKFALRIESLDNVTSSAAAAIYPCLGQSTTPVLPGTDIIVTRRSAGQRTNYMLAGEGTVQPLSDFTYYLQSNGTLATLIQTTNLGTYSPSNAPLSTSPGTAPMDFFKWTPRLYFIRGYAHTAGDGIPTLCRMELQHQATSRMDVECIADGIEDMQLQWGLDLNNDCAPDQYVNPSADGSTWAIQASQAVTARLWLRVRAAKPEPGYTDTKTYTLGNAPAYTPATTGTPPASSYRRRVYTTTVQLRNPIGVSGACTPQLSGGGTR